MVMAMVTLIMIMILMMIMRTTLIKTMTVAIAIISTTFDRFSKRFPLLPLTLCCRLTRGRTKNKRQLIGPYR